MDKRQKNQQYKLISSAIKSMDQGSKNTGLSPAQAQALKLVKLSIAGVMSGCIPLSQLQDALKQFNTSLKPATEE